MTNQSFICGQSLAFLFSDLLQRSGHGRSFSGRDWVDFVIFFPPPQLQDLTEPKRLWVLIKVRVIGFSLPVKT